MVANIGAERIPGALYVYGNTIIDQSTLGGSMATLDAYQAFRESTMSDLKKKYDSMTAFPLGDFSVDEVFPAVYANEVQEIKDLFKIELNLLETIAEQQLEQIKAERLQEWHNNYGSRPPIHVNDFEEKWFDVLKTAIDYQVGEGVK